MDIFVPAKTLETKYEVKKSVFYARAGAASTRQAAFELLAQCKNDYPDAGHHCWAYLLGSPTSPKSVAMSDDGEPSGTAGKPILNVLQHNDIGDIVVVVSRYFGGVKLGAGGLIRAYTAATQQTLSLLPTSAKQQLVSFALTCTYKEESYLRHLIEKFEGIIEEVNFQQQVTLHVSLPKNVSQEFVNLAKAVHANLMSP